MRAKAIYLLYRVAQALASPVVLLYFALRALRTPHYRDGLAERAGILPKHLIQTVPGAIWLHAISVGEIVAALELIRRLRVRLPDVPVLVSCGTLAGYATAKDKLSGLATGVFFAPVDYVFAVRRTLRAIQPSVLVILETEIWPNLFREARRHGAAVVVVNGRISDRTARRYASFRWFFGCILAQANRILAQSLEDRERFVDAGADPARVLDGGNLKYDFEPRQAPLDSPVRAWIAEHPGKRVWIAASTTADDRMAEEDPVLDAFAKLPGDWLLLLAPRKPDRFESVAANLLARALPFVRRTAMASETDARILLLDTIGELAGLFALADVVFMGGTLADRGGHNVLEPAFFAKPVIVGPHLENFREIAADFHAHRALLRIDAPLQLADAVLSAARDRETGERARDRAAAHRGATDRAVAAICELHASAIPVRVHNWVARACLTPLTYLWEIGGRRRAEEMLRKERKIDCPVVSVGNITTGGTGKTPFVRWLAARLKDAGKHPGILTRGYGRKTPDDILTLAAGSSAPVYRTGDEAQLLLRAGTAALGIGSDRWIAGMRLRERFASDVMLLDDGFQHRRLYRDLDIVLIDGLWPFGNQELMPLGRLREPMTALERAGAFVITRTEQSRIVDAVEHRLRDFNAAAPIFHARTVAQGWVEFPSNRALAIEDLTGERVVAFCGLGNPQGFARTLAGLGVEVVEMIEYDDHHAYSAAELRRLGQFAESEKVSALVTTEKDFANFCEGALHVLDGVRLYWLRIDLEIDEEEELLRLVAECRPVRK